MKKNPAFLPHALWVIALAVLAALLLFWPRSGGGQQPDNAPSFPKSAMIIERADGQKIPFTIEMATTREQESYGLMFRRSLPHDSGMLFLFDPSQRASMWMKNTYIPLDMLFVRVDGTIAKIVTNAEPFNLATITVDEPVRAVIEINGGEAALRGIKLGDKVRNAVFSGGS